MTQHPESESLLLHIEAIATKAKESKFSDEFLELTKYNSNFLMGYFDCNEIQTVLFSIICNLNLTRSTVEIDDISSYMECPPITIIKYMKELEVLCKMKLLRREFDDSRSRRRRMSDLNQIKFTINHGVLEAILNNKKYVPHHTENLDVYELLETVKGFMEERDNNHLTFEEMSMEIMLVLADNEKQKWINELMKFNLEENDLFLFLLLCCEFISGTESVDLSDGVKMLFPNLKIQLSIRREIINGTSDLIKKDLISLDDGFFRSDRVVRLTDRSIDLFMQDDRNLFVRSKEKKKPDIILSQEIIDKKLYFNQEEEQKLNFLTDILLPENFANLTSRMGEAGMKKGVAILFYGPPGTGKTESVYQIARKTGRDIKMVVISETKSMWFGESEKLIKGIFDKYRRIVDRSKVIPILLFNEADGIFSSRKQLGNSAVDQTENAIQNIILQEMEDLNGILIATTNLTQNLDKAFERRFLYKICFDKPTVNARFHIWKDKMPTLSERETSTLSEMFNLSGGQIDNIARKYLMKEVLHGTVPCLDELIGYCDEENFQPAIQKIGFRK